MFALALPDGRMYTPATHSALTLDIALAARWRTAESAATACDKANSQRTHLEPKFELVTLYQEADICVI